MTNKNIIHGEQVPIITLTRQQLEEDWYSLQNKLAREKAKNAELEKDNEFWTTQMSDTAGRNIELMDENENFRNQINELEKELKTYKCQEKHPNQCRCAFKCLGNEFCDEAENKIKQLEAKVKELEELANRCSKGWGETSAQLSWYKQSEQAQQENNYNLTMEVDTLKHTLSQIKEVAEKAKTKPIDLAVNDLHKILELIKEVENG